MFILRPLWLRQRLLCPGTLPISHKRVSRGNGTCRESLGSDLKLEIRILLFSCVTGAAFLVRARPNIPQSFVEQYISSCIYALLDLVLRYYFSYCSSFSFRLRCKHSLTWPLVMPFAQHSLMGRGTGRGKWLSVSLLSYSRRYLWDVSHGLRCPVTRSLASTSISSHGSSFP